jgi:hypothetical protein
MYGGTFIYNKIIIPKQKRPYNEIIILFWLRYYNYT